jgi:O-antigen/teichoic acid export membrane protein
MTPIVGAVLLPLFSRAKARSEEELDRALRRSLELVLSLTVPLALALEIAAPEAVRWIAGDAFAPAATALRLLAPVLVLNYVGMLCADCLYQLGRAWKVTVICVLGLGVNAGLNAVLIHPFLALGPGGGGIGAALATVGTELFTTTVFLWLIGRRVVDGRLCGVLGRTAVVCALVIALDLALAALGPGRLLVDGLAYVLLALAFRAVRVDEIRAFLRGARAG